MNNEIERIAQHNDMSVEFVTWFFNEKKSACGEHWFLVLGAMWEGWKGCSIEMDRLAAENVGLNKFIKQSCYVYNGDGSDISDSYIPAHESPTMPVQSQSLLPVAAECLAIRDAFICYLTSENMANKPDADEQQVYDHCAKWVDAMCETPATDAYLAGIKADGAEACVRRW